MSDEFQPPQPGPAHERLKPFEGTFKSEVKMWFGPGDPQVTTGTMVNSWHLNGLFLHQDYQGDATEGPFAQFQGKGYWGFNQFTGQYEGFWIDTAAAMFQTETGDVDDSGKVWTMLSEVPSPQGEGMMTKRTIITVVDDDNHSMEMFFVTPDGNEMKSMEITYTRA